MTRDEVIESLTAVDTDAAAKCKAWLPSVARLMQIAMGDTGQCRRVADFLLAWHNAEENGGWDTTDLRSVDAAIAEDMLTALRLLRYGEPIPWRSRFSKRKRHSMGTLEGGQTHCHCLTDERRASNGHKRIGYISRTEGYPIAARGAELSTGFRV
jgi:hypothetical protein